MKRKIVMIFIGLLLTIAGLSIFILSSRGVSLLCKDDNCELKRHSIFDYSSEKFRWSEVSRVGMVSGGSIKSGGDSSRRGVLSIDLTLDRFDGSRILVFGKPVGYFHGQIDYTSLDNMRLHKSPPKQELSAYSLGGFSYFLAPTFGVIGWFLVLFALVKSIYPNMPTSELSIARKWNLLIFSVLTIGFSLVWILFIRSLISWLRFY